jgi:branched-chain amino acid transport system substrate-binding protein
MLFRNIAAGALASLAFAGSSCAADSIKIGFIDPLSGPFGPVGTNQLNSWKFFIEKFNANNVAGVKFELVALDSKANPQALIAQQLTDQASASSSRATPRPSPERWPATAKHNRNPDNTILFLNYGAVDPASPTTAPTSGTSASCGRG